MTEGTASRYDVRWRQRS